MSDKCSDHGTHYSRTEKAMMGPDIVKQRIRELEAKIEQLRGQRNHEMKMKEKAEAELAKWKKLACCNHGTPWDTDCEKCIQADRELAPLVGKALDNRAELARALNGLVALAKELLDELGWKGSGNDKDIYYCFYCHASHADYREIQHADNCNVTNWRNRLAELEGKT